MKNKVIELLKRMSGIFLPTEVPDAEFLEEINESIKNLEYSGSKQDKQNLRRDMVAINRDFNKSYRTLRQGLK